MFSYLKARYFGGSREEEEEYGEEYDIFLSFNGKDTRKGFIDHLYIQLTDSGFSVFKDDVSLPVGSEIAGSLVKAITRSRIVMPILSENYGTSKWCMMELDCMMDCRKTMSLKVVPIFYDVTPHQVRHLTGSYNKAFLEHSKNYDLGTVEKWKKAVAEVGSIKGLELATDTAGCEGQFTKLIVAKVSDEFNRVDSHVTYKESALMKKHVAQITGLLDMGGPDKKMIVVCDNRVPPSMKFYRDVLGMSPFEGISFVKDIRKTAQQHNGLERMQNQLVYDLARKGDACLIGPYERMHDLRHKFRDKKVLILLEDVGDTHQLDALAGSLDWFGPGSRIIVTTRNRQVCNAHQVTDVYRLGKVS